MKIDVALFVMLYTLNHNFTSKILTILHHHFDFIFQNYHKGKKRENNLKTVDGANRG